MIHIRTILTLYIVILAINDVLVEAGQGTNKRKNDLNIRASRYNGLIKNYQNRFTNHFGFSMNPYVTKKLTNISNIIINHFTLHESFSLYLKNVFEVLTKYAKRQIASRFEKLKNIYEKWENKNFPNKEKKADALNILENQVKKNKNNQEKGNKGLEKKNLGNENKSKIKGDKKSIDKNDGQKKNRK